MHPVPPEELARRSASAMLGDDEASRRAGVELREVGPGRATLTMTVTPEMLNDHAMAHGGLAFLLADTAFAVACNSYGRRTVAAGCDITYLAPSVAGTSWSPSRRSAAPTAHRWRR